MRHKNFKRMAGILLTAVLLAGSFCGCSQGGGGESVNESGGKDGGSSGGAGNDSAMGRYLEEEMPLPDDCTNVFDIKKLEDGSLRFLGCDGNGVKKAWDSKDLGASWEKAYDFPEELQDEEKGYIDYAVLSGDGKAVLAYDEEIEDNGIKSVLFLMDKEGNASKIPFELPSAEDETSTAVAAKSVTIGGKDEEKGENPQKEQAGEGEKPKEEQSEQELKPVNRIVDLAILGNDQAMVTDTSGHVYQVNVSDGAVKHTYEFETVNESWQTYVAGNTLIAQSLTETLVYNTETGKEQSKEEALQKVVGENGFFSAIDTLDAGESIFCLSGGGLYHYKFGGSILEQLIDGSMNSLGAPAFYGICLTMLDKQNLLVAASDATADSAGGIVLLKYSYSPDTPAKPDKELKVYSLNDNREIRQSISRFQKEHTDVYVNYQVALAKENGVTVSDALKTLTTEIMAGNGPDVLLLDGMPVETYIEKGILKDISALCDGTEGTYYENVLNAYKDEKGQLCAIPARFMIPMIHAGSAYYSQGEDFDTFTQRKGALANMEPGLVVEKFWYSCAASWQKDDKTLDETKVTEFLKKLKNAYGEYDGRQKDDDSNVSYYDSESGAVEAWKAVSLDYGNFDLAFGRIHTNIGLYGGGDYNMLKAVDEKLENGILDLMPGQADHVFVPAMILGISSKAAQPEAAESFVKYLFSSEAQKVSQSGGFPVDKEAFRSVIDGHQYNEGASLVEVGCAGDNMDEILSYDMVPLTEEEIKKLTDLAESLTTPALRDDVIQEAVTEQGEKVLKGELSPEEGAKAIMQKINIYLAE